MKNVNLKSEKNALIFLVILILFVNYPYIDSFLKNSFEGAEYGFVERVIDGDTLVINGTSVRLLGINSPEKGDFGSSLALEFLSNKTLGKEVKLVYGKEKYDLYKRKLAYVFVGIENVNLESVKNGYSNFYFPSGKDKYYSKFKGAWESCLVENVNLCEKSSENCLILKDWDTKGQRVLVKNNCSKNLNITGWSVKDEGRKKYVFSEKVISPSEEVALTSEDWKETYVWTSSGDSIFIRDNFGKLVFWRSY
ncbi:MAG: thermonuclease family protein [archaeon]|nr:thermonuclease family protein [archaeon]